MELSPLAAHTFAAILEERTGQRLSGSRHWRLETSLRPVMRAYDCSSLEMLATRAWSRDGRSASAIRVAIAEALLNHETSFFRDRAAFDQLRDVILPALAEERAGRRRLRIWSAGCATGQEAYSLAMLFNGAPEPWQGWTIEIVGTDVSGAAVARAREGLYTQMEVQRGLGITELLANFTPEGESWQLRAEIRAYTRFAVNSLLDDAPPEPFDLILCRNVLLYLGESMRRAVFDRLAGALVPNGRLILGAGETVLGQTEAFCPDMSFRGCYRRVLPQSSGVASGMGAMPSVT